MIPYVIVIYENNFDENVRINLGWSLITLVSLMLSLNFGLMIYQTFIITKKVLKDIIERIKNRMRRKRKRVYETHSLV